MVASVFYMLLVGCSGWLSGFVMPFLRCSGLQGYSGCFLGCCCVVDRMFRVVARVLIVV